MQEENVTVAGIPVTVKGKFHETELLLLQYAFELKEPSFRELVLTVARWIEREKDLLQHIPHLTIELFLDSVHDPTSLDALRRTIVRFKKNTEDPEAKSAIEHLFYGDMGIAIADDLLIRLAIDRIMALALLNAQKRIHNVMRHELLHLLQFLKNEGKKRFHHASHKLHPEEIERNWESPKHVARVERYFLLKLEEYITAEGFASLFQEEPKFTPSEREKVRKQFLSSIKHVVSDWNRHFKRVEAEGVGNPDFEAINNYLYHHGRTLGYAIFYDLLYSLGRRGREIHIEEIATFTFPKLIKEYQKACYEAKPLISLHVWQPAHFHWSAFKKLLRNWRKKLTP